MTQKVYQIANQTSLFNGVEPKQMPAALSAMNARLEEYDKGEFFTAINTPFRRAGLVINGELEVSCITENYTKFIMGHFKAGQVFGVALAIDRLQSSPMQLTAIDHSVILSFDPTPLTNVDSSTTPLKQQLMANMIKFISKKNYFLTTKLHTTMQKNIHDKLTVYFQQLPTDPHGDKHLPFNQTQLAEYIGVNRSALSRELRKMQDNGEIELNSKVVRIK